VSSVALAKEEGAGYRAQSSVLRAGSVGYTTPLRGAGAIAVNIRSFGDKSFLPPKREVARRQNLLTCRNINGLAGVVVS